jgi:hypothetical protein
MPAPNAASAAQLPALSIIALAYGLLQNQIESGHKAKSGGKKIGAQAGDISRRLVLEAAQDIDQHRCNRGNPHNYKDRESDWRRCGPHSFSASVRIGHQKS